MVLRRVLNAHHILDILYHTHRATVAAGVRANGACLGLADVVTHVAVANILAQLDETFSETSGHILWLLEQIEHKPESRFAPYSWQLRKLAHSVLE